MNFLDSLRTVTQSIKSWTENKFAKNDHKHASLTFTGAVTATYDGSSAKTVNIIGEAGTGTKAEMFNGASGAYGNNSHAEGFVTRACGASSHAEGYGTIAYGYSAHTEGSGTWYSVALSGEANARTYTIRTAQDSVIVGMIIVYGKNHAKITFYDSDTLTITVDKTLSETAISNAGAMLYQCVASGSSSHAEGDCTIASGNYSHAEGYYTVARAQAQHAQGKFNISKDSLAHIVGNGNSETERSNAHTLDWSGNAYYAGSMTSNGADYAELFEWADGNPDNEDRRGRFVTLDGEKVRFATDADDYILGVVSAAPAVLGDRDDCWQGRWVTDVFGERLTKEYVTVDEETGEECTNTWWIENPEYDSSVEYIPREERKEWAKIGMIGKLVVIDDGTCKVNGYCKSNADGIATSSETGYRVMARIDDTHIRVLFK